MMIRFIVNRKHKIFFLELKRKEYGLIIVFVSYRNAYNWYWFFKEE